MSLWTATEVMKDTSNCWALNVLLSRMLSWSKNIYFWNLVFRPFLVCPRRSLVGAHSSVHLSRVDIFVLPSVAMLLETSQYLIRDYVENIIRDYAGNFPILWIKCLKPLLRLQRIMRRRWNHNDFKDLIQILKRNIIFLQILWMAIKTLIRTTTMQIM